MGRRKRIGRRWKLRHLQRHFFLLPRTDSRLVGETLRPLTYAIYLLGSVPCGEIKFSIINISFLPTDGINRCHEASRSYLIESVTGIPGGDLGRGWFERGWLDWPV